MVAVIASCNLDVGVGVCFCFGGFVVVVVIVYWWVLFLVLLLLLVVVLSVCAIRSCVCASFVRLFVCFIGC